VSKKQLNVRGGYKPVSYRSPWWMAVNYFQTRVWQKSKVRETEIVMKKSEEKIPKK